jgi:hypothetical protein
VTILPALKQRINKNLQYLDSEVVRVLQSNHKSLSSTAKIKADSAKLKLNKKRVGKNSHMQGVSFFLYK